METETERWLRVAFTEEAERFERDAETVAAGEGFENPLPFDIDAMVCAEDDATVQEGVRRAVLYFRAKAEEARKLAQGGAS